MGHNDHPYSVAGNCEECGRTYMYDENFGGPASDRYCPACLSKGRPCADCGELMPYGSEEEACGHDFCFDCFMAHND